MKEGHVNFKISSKKHLVQFGFYLRGRNKKIKKIKYIQGFPDFSNGSI